MLLVLLLFGLLGCIAFYAIPFVSEFIMLLPDSNMLKNVDSCIDTCFFLSLFVIDFLILAQIMLFGSSFCMFLHSRFVSRYASIGRLQSFAYLSESRKCLGA